MTSATIDHTGHDHPATKAAREKCRVHRRLNAMSYPEAQRSGSVFHDDGKLWQRLALNADSVNRGDMIAGFQVVGHSTDARHDNHPAVRLDLVQGNRTGRLVVQADSELNVYREFDPERAEMFIDLDIESTDAEFVLREVFDLTSKTMVVPKMLTFAGPGGYPIVRFTGPKKDLEAVIKRHSPSEWVTLVLEMEPAVGAPEPTFKYNFLPWQHDRVENLLAGGPSGKKWFPTRFVLGPEDKPRKTIFNQDVRDGWVLRFPGDAREESTRYVGRELMAALVEQYPDRLDLPDGFMP